MFFIVLNEGKITIWIYLVLDLGFIIMLFVCIWIDQNILEMNVS